MIHTLNTLLTRSFISGIYAQIPDMPFAYMITFYNYMKMLEAKGSSSDSNRICRRYVLKKNWTKLVLDEGQLQEDQ
jgi:hypothetical protein